MKKSFIILTNKYLLILFEATVCGAIKRPYRLMKSPRQWEEYCSPHLVVSRVIVVWLFWQIWTGSKWIFKPFWCCKSNFAC